MNKAELVERVSEQVGSDKGKVGQIIDIALGVIIAAIARHESVSILNFGVFEARRHGGGNTRNPKSGEIVKTDPFARPHFRPSRKFKATVKNGKEVV